METLLEHKETLLWFIVLLNFSLVVVLATFGSKSANQRQIRSLRLQLERLEEHLGDLSERFSRKQSRDAMRAARETKDAEKTLTEQAAAIVAQNAAHGGPSSQAGDRKTELRMRLKGSSAP